MNVFLPLIPMGIILAYAIFVAYRLDKIREARKSE
jgi:hypothetical protein